MSEVEKTMSRFKSQVEIKTEAKTKRAVKRRRDTGLEALGVLAGYGICLTISCSVLPYGVRMTSRWSSAGLCPTRVFWSNAGNFEVRRVLHFCDLQAKSGMGWYGPKGHMG